VILVARALLLDAGTWIGSGGLVVARGRVRAVLRSRAAVRRARAGRRVHDLGDVVLAPGLVDAHAHLDLCMPEGKVAPRGAFMDWIGAVVRARRALTRAAVEHGVRAGARALLASGTTAIGDIDASGATARLAPGLGARIVVYRELLDAWDPARTAAALAGVRRALPRRARVHEGLAPHAPYTTSDGLLVAARTLARRRDLALSIHWAETPEEERWLAHGTGPFRALLPASPRRSGLARLAAAGLLGRRTSLVHGNCPAPGDVELLARRGVTLVHCPGTHAFFARPRFALERYLAAGVPLALGTDSLASNDGLDMRVEMARLRASHPRLAPAQVFALATAGGARALGLADVGHLRPGAAADVVAWELGARTHADALDELTAARAPVARVFVAGACAAGRETTALSGL
jgi:cytosine/adenosine deaminase-related metal-dependent hydrolase